MSLFLLAIWLKHMHELFNAIHITNINTDIRTVGWVTATSTSTKKKNATNCNNTISCIPIKGASTSATRGKRKSKKKRRRRKKKRKSRKAKDKPPASRYLLLHEMEPSASFSIFGNDFSLECLPGVEPPAPIATPKAESQR